MQPSLHSGVKTARRPEPERIPARLARLITSPKAYAKQKSLLAGLAWLRAILPLARVETEDFDPFWVVTRHSDVCEIIGRHDLFHNGDRAHTLVPRASDDMARSMTGGSPHPIRTLVHMDEPEADEPRMLKLTQELFASEDLDLGRGEGARNDPARHAKELFRLLGEFQAYFIPLM